MRELLRQERQQPYLLYDPELLYGNNLAKCAAFLKAIFL
jgi:hypothetical protein